MNAFSYIMTVGTIAYAVCGGLEVIMWCMTVYKKDAIDNLKAGIRWSFKLEDMYEGSISVCSVNTKKTKV